MNFDPRSDSAQRSIQDEINKLDEMPLRSALQGQHVMHDHGCI
jgi:hypothetical protein